VASVCDPETLLDALRAGTIEAPGGVRLVGSAVTRRTYAVGNGISQLVGAPLRPGEQLRVAGNIAVGTLLRVRVAAGNGTVDAVFRLPSTRSSTVRLEKRGGVASLRIVDGLGTAYRPIAVQQTEVSASTG
jgi:hypothetical protein